MTKRTFLRRQVGMKFICTGCLKEKLESDFYFDPHRGKYNSQCVICRRIQQRSYAAKRRGCSATVAGKITKVEEPHPDGIAIEDVKKIVKVGDIVRVEKSYLGEPYIVKRTVVQIMDYGVLTKSRIGLLENFSWIDVLMKIKKNEYVSA